MIRKIIILLAFLPGLMVAAYAQPTQCVDIDTNRIVNEAAISLSEIDSFFLRKGTLTNPVAYHNPGAGLLTIVAETNRKKIAFTLRYQLRQPDEFYNWGCYLLVQRADVARKFRKKTLKRFERVTAVADSLVTQVEDERSERAFTQIAAIWNFRPPNLPCPLTVELIQYHPTRSRTTIGFDLKIYSCVPVKTELLKE